MSEPSSLYERARRDPLFHALVMQQYHLMRQGDGKWTPTEVREAAMLAHVMLEQGRTHRFLLTPDGTLEREDPHD